VQNIVILMSKQKINQTTKKPYLTYFFVNSHA